MTGTWEQIALEVRQHNASGPRIVAVAGAVPERSRQAAAALASALEEQGESVESRQLEDITADRLRAEVVAPFRADRGQDQVLVVSGPADLLADDVRGLWHFTLWNSAGDEPTHPDATSLVDMTDATAPRRRYADACGTADCCND